MFFTQYDFSSRSYHCLFSAAQGKMPFPLLKAVSEALDQWVAVNFWHSPFESHTQKPPCSLVNTTKIFSESVWYKGPRPHRVKAVSG